MSLHTLPIFYKDFYKVGHYEQYPAGTQLVFSNFTPRKSRIERIKGSVFFGLNYFIKNYLEDAFKRFFFDLKREQIISDYKSVMQQTLGIEKEWGHIGKLHDLGYLPIAICSVDEGVFVPEGVPALVIFNTHPDFYWLPNMLETLLSCVLWGASNSATIAYQYRKILDQYAQETSDNPGFVDYQAHDFSFRGMFGMEAAMLSGAAHLQYFKGTDTIPAILFRNSFYDSEISCGCSVPATEHSVMSAGSKENEFETYKRLITEVYPKGIVSIVSDTWDLWEVLDNYLPKLKNEILARDGKVVIRPDSGDPVKIICGNSIEWRRTPFTGVVETLWDIFGGTINSKGYKELDPHIGVIYGDSITLEIAEEICEKLKLKGFASTNIVFGIGSYTYQYNTRDTFGWAMKATYAEINGEGVNLFKDPVTDNGTKRSHKGLLKVIKNSNSELSVLQEISWDQFYAHDNELKLRFKNGERK
jgi:nicotinamide phosphoribosyltransferase